MEPASKRLKFYVDANNNSNNISDLSESSSYSSSPFSRKKNNRAQQQQHLNDSNNSSIGKTKKKTTNSNNANEVEIEKSILEEEEADNDDIIRKFGEMYLESLKIEEEVIASQAERFALDEENNASSLPCLICDFGDLVFHSPSSTIYCNMCTFKVKEESLELFQEKISSMLEYHSVVAKCPSQRPAVYNVNFELYFSCHECDMKSYKIY